MIDPKKYMVVMALAVLPRKALMTKGKKKKALVTPMKLRFADGSAVQLSSLFIVGEQFPELGQMPAHRPGTSMERMARERVDTLFECVEEVHAKMPGGAGAAVGCL